MSKKNTRNTKNRIVTAAWELFYEQGYDETTVEEIIERSGTSRGSFYHYFEGKDSLLSTLSLLFDDLLERMDSILIFLVWMLLLYIIETDPESCTA